MSNAYPQSEVGTASSSDGLTLVDLWKILRRWRLVALSIVALCLVLAVTASIVSTRQYQATGEIQVQKDSSDALGLDSLMSSAGAGAGDALDANVTLQTQAKILESETLGLQVITQLHLGDADDFKPRFNPVGWVVGLVSPTGPPDAPVGPSEISPRKRDRLFAIFKSNTKVAPVAGTRLIEVSYTSASPKEAAAAVNSLIEGLVDYNFQTRYSATSQASDWLGKQLSDLRANSEQLQARVAELQRDSGVFTFGGEDIQGKGIAYSTVLDQLQQATVNLTQAQSNRVLRGALYEAAKSGDPEMIAGLSGSAMAGSLSPAAGNSLALIQGLRTQEAQEKAQIGETASKFGAAYPKLEEMRANLASVEQSIQAEQGRLQSQTKSDFTVAQEVETHMREIFDAQKKGAEGLNDKAIQYAIVRQEADESRALYERLLSKLKEAGVLEGLRSSNITVVEPGRVPSRPSKPKVLLYLAAAIFGGLLLGGVTAFLFEVMDSKVRDIHVLSRRFGDALFGELPFERPRVSAAKDGEDAPRHAVFTLDSPSSSYSEELRGLRTAILLARGGSPPKSILVTSSVSGEGKSTLSANLAVLLAQQGRRVLLVDADLRRPSIHKFFGLANTSGLSNLLTNEIDPEPALSTVRRLERPATLDVLPAGQIPPYPSELLGSEQMRTLIRLWREHYDFIVLDGAPVLPVTDSVVVAPLADQILLLARHASTQRAFLDKSYHLLRSRAPSTPIGIVVNAIKRFAEPNYYSYSYNYTSKPVTGNATQKESA